MTDTEKEMVYYEAEPDIAALSQAYSGCIGDLGFFFDQCERNYNSRRNLWPGKSYDLRKHGADAFPWDGASDQEVHVIDEKVDARVALATFALEKSHIKANAVKMQSMARAGQVSSFVKWMRTTYIRDFDTQYELNCNHLNEKGIAITYVGWEKKDRTHKQDFDLGQIRETSPEIAAMIEEGGSDDEIVAMLQTQWPKLRPGRALKCLRQLRAKGFAELYVSRSSPMDSRPFVKACSPDGEVFFPVWCMDPQRSPYCFWRQTYTAQEILGFVATEGWDREWAEYVIEHCGGMGVDDLTVDTQYQTRSNNGAATGGASKEELFLVIRGYQRLIDDEDGSEGIYCTAFSPHHTEESNAPAMAKRELLNGYDQYPFIVTRSNSDQCRMYDLQALPERLWGAQKSIKVERDSRTDRASVATLPEMTGPPGRQPSQRGPGRYIPVRRAGEYQWMNPPAFDPGSLEIEATTMKMADAIAGMDPENPLTPILQQFGVNKALKHAAKTLAMAYTCFQRFGPDEIFFNVTGNPDPITMENVGDDEFDINITFDTLSNDPENAKAQAEFFSLLIQADKTGRLDAGRHTEFMARSVNSAYADYVLLPADENSAKLQRAITDDFAKLYAGVAIGPQPNGAQITLQMLEGWMQEPDVGERMQSDEAFQNRVTNYAKQAQFQIQQAQNAETGKIGTAPTQFQNSNIV